MKEKTKKRLLSTILCLTLLLGVVGTGAALETEAATTALETVYEAKDDVQSYRGDKRGAPVKDGYVFAGWYKKDTAAESGYSPMSEGEADAASSAYAKFVDKNVLSFGYQLTAGTTIQSEKTNWRLLTSVDSLLYESVGFEVNIAGKISNFISTRVYKTINGYEYKDAYNYPTAYTPKQTFTTVSEYFMAFTLSGVPNYAYAGDMTVTPMWMTLDGTKVFGVSETINIESALCNLGTNLQTSKGTDFEGFATLDITSNWGEYVDHYVSYDTRTSKVWLEGVEDEAYLKMLPTTNNGTASITKACGAGMLMAGSYRMSMKVKLGSAADGTLSFGFWDGIAWVPGWPLVNIDISKANADNWTKVTYDFEVSNDSAGTFTNMDLKYICNTAGENNYILIDDIEIIDKADDKNVDRMGFGDFEGFVTAPAGVLGASDWVADNSGRNVVYVNADALENEIVVEKNGNSAFKFYTSDGASSGVNFSGDTGFATAGIYKMSAKVKLGSDATKVDNIGFRFYSQNNLGVGDLAFDGLKQLSSDKWVTLVKYFEIPATVSTTWINMNFWVFTHNDEIQSADNYVLMDDIEVTPISLKACDHKYAYEYTTKPTNSTEGAVTATCQNKYCDATTSFKLMKTPRLLRNGLTLSWNAVDKAAGYKLYDNDKIIADLGTSLSCTIAPGTSHKYTVEAYTSTSGYRNASDKSNEIYITVADNMQISQGTDFEGFSTFEVVDAWNYEYFHAAHETSKVYIVNDGTSSYAKLLSNSAGAAATITRACGMNVLKAGTYQISMDVCMGNSAGGRLSFGIYNGYNWMVDNLTLSTADAYADPGNWVTITKEYTVPFDYAGYCANLDIKYTGVNGDYDDYVLIDNIQIIDTNTGKNVDTKGYGDFEGINTTFDGTITESGWHADSTGRNVFYVGADALENEIVVDKDGNKSFKFYTSTGRSTTADFAGNPEIATAGKYKLSARVKLGPDAANVDNIGFRFYAQGGTLGTGDITFSGLDKLSSEEWVTLEAYYEVPETVTTPYVNINIWVFTHNDEIQSADNYVLIDDIEVCSGAFDGRKMPVYSSIMESVYDQGVVTGVLAPKDTLASFGIGGTDLGIPYYDDVRKQMYFLFGDSFAGINDLNGNWRSQVVGISTDLDMSDGFTFDSFISDSNGTAVQIIDSLHSKPKGEITCIPTGGIAINGTHYVFYMSIREWLDEGWEVNYCGVAKSTDGKNFTELKNLYWAENTSEGQSYTQSFLGQSAANVANQTSSDFAQIFPYRVGDYVYIFGIPAGRGGGMKLGRVHVNNIETFSKYEYYCGVDSGNNPIWTAGKSGLDSASYIVNSGVGEFSVCYNEYLGKYVMSYYSNHQIVMRTSDDLINWSDKEVITTAAHYLQIYGGFAHELHMEQNGKVMYFYISQYQNEKLGEDGYNVKQLKVIFK